MSCKMRLALCLYKYFPFGGLQRDFMKVCKECLQRGHEVDVYTITWEGEVPERPAVFQVPVSGLTNHRRYESFAKEAGKRIRTRGYDVVVGFNKMPGLDVYYAADVCFAYVAQKRSFLYRLSGRCRGKIRLERSVFDRDAQTQILLLSEKEKPLFVRFYGTGEERFHSVPAGIEEDRRWADDSKAIRNDFREAMKIRENEKLILMVGSNYKLKGVDRALRALASLPPPLGTKTRMLVVGRGKKRPMQSLARRLGVEDRVSFLGERKDIPRFLFSADLLMHPSYVEAAGIVLLEAIAAGLPCLVTGNCGYTHHVERAGSGLVVSSLFRQDELNEKLMFMLCSEDSTHWKKAALDYAAKEDIFSMPGKVVDLIEQACLQA